MASQKAIFWVIGLQTVLLLFLAFRSFTLEGQLAQLSYDTERKLSNERLIPAAAGPATTTPAIFKSASDLSSSDVRQIVSEEIQKLSDQIAGLSAAPSKAPAKPVTAAEARAQEQQYSAVVSQISALGAQDGASGAELARLEQNIANLPPAQRIKALGELNKAINAGYINTRF